VLIAVVSARPRVAAPCSDLVPIASDSLAVDRRVYELVHTVGLGCIC